MCQAMPPEAERVRGAMPCAHPPTTLSLTGLLKSPVPSPLSYQRGVGTARRPGGWAALVCSPISGAVTLQHLRDGKQQRGRSSAKPGVWALNYGRERCWQKRGGGGGAAPAPGPPPTPRAQPGPSRRPPSTVDTEKPKPSARGGVWWSPQACPWSGASAASKQQGFLLEVVPLPEGQAVKLFHAHPKHFLELLGRQVSLQIKMKTQRGAVSNFGP